MKIMYKNYLKIALRSIWKNKIFSLINIIGLSIGLSASFVIGVIVYYDLTFDKFHTDGNNIYRVTTEFTSTEGNYFNHGASIPLGDALKENTPGITAIGTFFMAYIDKAENKAADISFKNIKDAVFADASYFELFEYKWLAGNKEELLSNPNEVILTKKRAAKYFPGTTPEKVIGKTLVYNDSLLVKVTAIVADFEQRSDFYFKEFLSVKTANNTRQKEQIFNDEWNNTSSFSQLFLKVAENGDLASIQKQLDALAKEHQDKTLADIGQGRIFHLQALGDLHFNQNFGVFDGTDYHASKTQLISLALIALFLLLLGCINFINLNTAQATQKAKEIGIRKTLGSSKKQLVFQFLGETFLLTVSAAAVSIVISFWLLRYFSDFMPQGVNFDLFSTPEVLISIVVLLGVVTLLSGFYPALVLAQLRPVLVLKNHGTQGDNKSSLRKYLTVFQFVVAQIFIISTLVVAKQLHYVMNKDMGFKTEAITNVRIPFQDKSMSKRYGFVEAVKALPHVSQASLGWIPPASNSNRSTIVTYVNDKQEIHTSLQLLTADLDYLKVYGIQLMAGRDRLNDTINEYVINETYSKVLGFKNPVDALGKIVKTNNEQIPIVGVMKDFNQRSLRTSIKPMALEGDRYRGQGSQFNMAHIALQGETSAYWPATIKKIEKAYKTFYPEAEFELNFFDESIKRFYEQDRRTSILLKWAMGLAIGISCLGLLGLVIYSTERRRKEVGIRKVLGATLAQLNLLLCKEFLVLVGIAYAIAAPIAWWGMSNWLEDFNYKTELSWWIFVISGMAMLLIALVVIVIRTIVVANANPVQSLRTE